MWGTAQGKAILNRLPGLLKDRHLAKKVCVDIAEILRTTRVSATHLVPFRTIYNGHASSQGVVSCNSSTGAHSPIYADQIRLDKIRRNCGIHDDNNLIAAVAEYNCICALGTLQTLEVLVSFADFETLGVFL